MPSLLAGALIAVLAVWLAVSAIAQIRDPRVLRVRRYDPFGLIPRWNLFSPRPIASDLIVRYRVWEDVQSGSPSEWHSLPMPGTRRLTDGLFSLERRAKRTIYSHALTCVRVYGRYPGRPDLVIGTSAYLHLLARTSRDAAAAGASRIQFQILRVHRTRGEEVVVPLFRSAVHAV